MEEGLPGVEMEANAGGGKVFTPPGVEIVMNADGGGADPPRGVEMEANAEVCSPPGVEIMPNADRGGVYFPVHVKNTWKGRTPEVKTHPKMVFYLLASNFCQ